VVGVVATGLDIVYPRRHGSLFARVRRHGLVLGEHGFGVPPTKARFPIRNRIIAGLVQVGKGEFFYV
jgi:DNA processing protein